MNRELLKGESLRESAGGVAIRTVESQTFAYLLMNGAVDLKFGVEPILEGETKITYGAGPCIAGIVYFRDGFYMFHQSPTEFTKPQIHLQEADWGYVGGGVDLYEGAYGGKLSPNIVVNRQGYCFSLAASRHMRGKMDIFWRYAF